MKLRRRARVGSWAAGQEVVVAGQKQRKGQLMPSLGRSHSVELVSEKESNQVVFGDDGPLF